MRGTAILVRKAIPITIKHKLLSGRAMSVEYSGLRLINVYIPSGSARRTERKNIFNAEFACLLLYRPLHHDSRRRF